MENDPSLSKQIWYSCHLTASFICFLSLFSMSRCSLNLEPVKCYAQLLCFCSRACVLVPVPLGTTPWVSTHHGLAKVPSAWDIHPAVCAPGKGSFASESAPKSVTYIQKKDGLSMSSPALINTSKLTRIAIIIFKRGYINTKNKK